MNNNPQKLRLLVLLGLGVIAATLVTILAVATIQSGQLRVESIDPEDGGAIPQQAVAIVTFNRDIETASVTLEPEIGYEAVFVGKTITVTPYSKFDTGSYTLTINDAVSKDGKSMKSFTSTFTVAEVASQSEANAEQSRNLNIEERTALKYPFLANLYQSERAFDVSFRIEPKPYDHPIYNRVVYKDLTILVNLRADVDWGPVRGQDLINELNKSKQKFLDYFTNQRGLNPSEFVIKYTPDPDASVETGD